MADIIVSREIAAPPEEVWRLVADVTRATESWTDQRHPVMAWNFGKVTGVTDRASHNRPNIERTLESLDRAATAA